MRHSLASAGRRLCQNRRTIRDPWATTQLPNSTPRCCSVNQVVGSVRHSSHRAGAASSVKTKDGVTNHDDPCKERQAIKRQPLSILPLSMIIRSLATSTFSSSPKLLSASLYVLRTLAYSESRFLNPERNPILRFILNKSLYKQFCAGQDAKEVAASIAQLKHIGFTGAILAYAKESPSEPADAQGGSALLRKPTDTKKKADGQISEWFEGSLETVRLATAGDFIALKFTGSGSLAYEQLAKGLPPGPYLTHAIHQVCDAARDKGVRVLIDSEHDELQDSIDRWTMQLAKKYNTIPGKAVIFGTYQAYKKSMPQTLASHLAEAFHGGFTLGVKLVRGAYLHSDPPERLHASKPETDACYDATAASVLTRSWNETLRGSGAYPETSIMFATHNATSVRKAYAIYAAGRAQSEILFAQLQGMADEISCELVEMKTPGVAPPGQTAATPADTCLPVYKYMAWGTTGECMKYLLRRAEENRDAVVRTREDRDAMWTELVRRAKAILFVP